MRSRSLNVVLALLTLLNAGFVAAQSVSFAGTQTTVTTSGVYYPYGLAVDRAGDVFIADAFNNRVVEAPAGGGPQITVAANGLNEPFGVAVDGAGDVFIADTENSRVLEVPAGGGPQTTVGSGLSVPYGVAVDGVGDVFIADTGNNRVVEVPAGGGAQTIVGSGLNAPVSVAVDGAGDVFIVDYENNRVVEVPAGGGPQTTVGSGLSHPWGVGADAAGDVFIADSNNGRVVEVPAGGGPQTTVASGLGYPTAAAVDGVGDVFIMDNGNNWVVEVQPVAVNFGAANICPGVQTTPAPCNQTFTLNYNVTAPATFGAINVVTQGAPSLDFTMSSSTCIGAMTSGSSCTVVATFAPQAPGVRMGGVQLTDNSGNVLVTTLVHGIGMGPAIAFGPGVQTTIPTSGLANPYCLAIDGAGNVFVADPSNARVVKVPAGGGSQTTVGTGFVSPFAVAVDGAGDVFVSDIGLNQVIEVPAGGGPQITVGVGLSGPYGLAVDGSGNVFIADSFNNRVVKVPAGGGPQITVASGLYPFGVAVDGAGNLFVSDRTSGNNQAVEIPANGGAQITLAVGLNNPSGMAVDGAGDVFVADFDNDRVLEIPPGGGAPTTLKVVAYDAFDMAVDGAGNVFVMDWGNSRVVELQRSQPPALTFASTAVGSTSTDSPQSVTAQNVGNQLLQSYPPGLSLGQSFVQVAGSGTPADCTTTFSLAPGASCNLSVSFTPQTIGNLLSSATFVDNALNAPANSTSAAQSVALQGTATQDNQSITFEALANQSLGTAPFALSATASSSLAVSFTSTTSAVCTVSTSTVTPVTAGTCTIQATQAGNATYFAATPVSQSFQISDFALTSNSPMTVTAGQPATFTLTTTPQGTYPSAITLSCGTLPAMAACDFTPSATVTPNAITVTTTLTITTAAHTTSSALAAGPRSNSLYAVWLLLPALLLGTAAKASPKGRKLLTFGLVFLVLGACLFQSACGGASINPATGTPAGTYSVIVTGAAGSNQHTTTVMLTVQ